MGDRTSRQASRINAPPHT